MYLCWQEVAATKATTKEKICIDNINLTLFGIFQCLVKSFQYNKFVFLHLSKCNNFD